MCQIDKMYHTKENMSPVEYFDLEKGSQKGHTGHFISLDLFRSPFVKSLYLAKRKVTALSNFKHAKENT